jgi:hypothetical protein
MASQPLNPIGTIGQGCLMNSGGFVCKIYFKWWNSAANKGTGGWIDSNRGGGFTNPNNKCEDPGDLGVPNNMVVRLCADVVWGDDNYGQEQFTYVSQNTNSANYVITGTTLDNHMKYQGITSA